MYVFNPLVTCAQTSVKAQSWRHYCAQVATITVCGAASCSCIFKPYAGSVVFRASHCYCLRGGNLLIFTPCAYILFLLQAQLFRVRSGLRALRSWAKLSPYLRHRRLLVLNHSTRRVTQSIFSAWKSAVFPLGLRGQWAPRVRARRDGKPAQDEGIRLRLPKTSKTINAASSGEVEYLGLIEATPKSDQGGRSPLKDATNEQADKISLNHDSLVLLRLPMVGKRMRRVLHAWRKLAKKGKRLNYIRDMLPQKVSVCRVSSVECKFRRSSEMRKV